jgi:hypothetical protein
MLLGQGLAQDAPPNTCVAQKALIPGLGVRVAGDYHGQEFEDFWFPSGSESSNSIGPSNKFRSCRATGHPYPVPYEADSVLSKGCGSEHTSFTPKKDKDDIGNLPPFCPTGSMKPELMAMLAELDHQNTKFDRFIYAVRSVNFTFLAAGTAFEPFAPLGNAAGKMAQPLQHHQLFFHIDGSPRLIAPPLLANETANRKWLLVHMQGDGVHGRMLTDSELPTSRNAWTWEIPAPVEPRWIEDFLRDDAHTTYSHLFWNCQIFASQLLAFLGKECRSWKMPVCPPEDAEDKIPLIIYQGKGLRLFSAFVIALLAFLYALSSRMGWSCRGCLRRSRCGRGKIAEASLEADLLEQ